ncbi:DHHW family protein [Adlercreutzia sp. ZJ141]|uniref:DHHW family protein n=1 Tax=Adlercreutzia sp. ZJ141 TaxID=2709406 RepID=UPI0013EC90BC|nr:DHHW family protein [Adlercreutzia sp. ZJ141]
MSNLEQQRKIGQDQAEQSAYMEQTPQVEQNSYAEQEAFAQREVYTERVQQAEQNAYVEQVPQEEQTPQAELVSQVEQVSQEEPTPQAPQPTQPAQPTQAQRPSQPPRPPRARKRRATDVDLLPRQAMLLSKADRRTMGTWWTLAIKLFNGVMCVGFVLGLCLFLRPQVSEAENRKLTEFPQITWETFWDGSFTADVSTWYADTFPFRDQLMAVNHWMRGFYGIEPNEQVIGGERQADDIPDQASAPTTPPPAPEAKPPEDYDSSELETNIQGEIMNGTYVKDGACYSRYYFTQEAANAYSAAVNKAVQDLGDAGMVYSIVIPNNSGALLSDDELAALGGSNQADAISYYYSLYDERVRTVPTTDTLREHNSEYLYFRTDHHWTALGAYYIYRNFCEQKGIEPHNIADYEEVDFDGFLGTYYGSLKLDSMAKNPDVVQTWAPKGTNDMTFTDTEGNVVDWNVIEDVSAWNQGSKYNCFIGGDQPWAEIHNPNITDGSACVVVKESYGNAFVPWLVDHYQHVYIADFRYTSTNVVDFMKEHGVGDLIIINNIGIAGNVDVAGKIASIV